MLVYVLTNTVNGKKYVGKTVLDNLNSYFATKRWQAAHGNRGNMPVVAAIAKYGWDKFSIAVVAKVSDSDLLNVLERVWIKDLGTRDPKVGYNVQEGGNSGRTGVKTSEATKLKIGAANKGRKPKGYVRNNEHRQQLSNRMKGNKVGIKFTPARASAIAASMTPQQRKERAQKAAQKRWNKEAQLVEAG